MDIIPTGQTLAIIAGIGGWAGVWHAVTLAQQAEPLSAERLARIAALPVIWSGCAVVFNIFGNALVRSCAMAFASMFHPVPFIINIFVMCAVMIGLSIFGAVRKAFRSAAETVAEEMALDAAIAAAAAATQAESDSESEAGEQEASGADSESEAGAESEEMGEEATQDTVVEESQSSEAVVSQSVAEVPVSPLSDLNHLPPSLSPTVSEPLLSESEEDAGPSEPVVPVEPVAV